MDNHPDVMLVG